MAFIAVGLLVSTVGLPIAATAVKPFSRDLEPRRLTDPVYDFRVTTDVQYGVGARREGPDEPLLLDLYDPIDVRPGQAPAGRPLRPVFIFAHGGSLIGGDKATGSGKPVWLSSAMARRGYVAASINYRLLTPFGPTEDLPEFGSAINPELIQGLQDAQHDMQAAVRWFRAKAEELHIDPDQIVVAGHSAGGGTALNVNYRSDDPGDSGNPGFPSDVAGAIAYSSTMLEPSSIDGGDPPVKIFTVVDDLTNPYPLVWASTCGPAMSVGATCDLVTFTSGGHGLNGHEREILGGTVDFFCRFVVTTCET